MMPTKVGREDYRTDLEEEFLSDAILDLRRGETTYVYKQKILDKLKQIFNDLDITRNDFYWTVRNKEVIKTNRGRPRKVEIR